MMKKTWVACAAGLLFVTGAANAISVSGEAGQHYTNLGVGMSTGSSGLGLTGNWARSDHDGNVGSVGLNFGVPLGPLTATVGAKALYLSPKDGKSGGAVALGGGLRAVWATLATLATALTGLGVVLAGWHRPSDPVASALVAVAWAVVGLLVVHEHRARIPLPGS